jgi:hypothetical protein
MTRPLLGAASALVLAGTVAAATTVWWVAAAWLGAAALFGTWAGALELRRAATTWAARRAFTRHTDQALALVTEVRP